MTVINEAISNTRCTFFGSSGDVGGCSGSLWTISLENVISVLAGDGVTAGGRRYTRRDEFRCLTALGGEDATLAVWPQPLVGLCYLRLSQSFFYPTF